MGTFTTPLKVQYIDGKKWKLVSDLIFRYIRDGNVYHITIPTGFVTDFASIPRWLWVIAGNRGKYNKAAVLHDYLYKTQIMSRKESDRLYRKMMIPVLPKWKVHAAYYVVRAVSWLFWK
jgi:hypothetical protein